MANTATIKERNALFGALNQINRGQSVALYVGHRLTRAAREFEAEGLVQVIDGTHIAGSTVQEGETLRVVRAF